ncbi:MAG TPA: shikimate kinase [Gemmatimonadales bacterium]
MKRHIVLIGLPGSGKTTVGQLVATRLGAAFVDIDAVIARREGRPIAMIFAEKGEGAFREMEKKEMETTLATEPTVIAPGGGWAAQAGSLEGLRSSSWLVYLKTRAETAAQRAGPEGNRPVLSGEDPVARMRVLLKERESSYVQAEVQVETDRRTPEQVAAEVVRLAQTGAGW